MHYYNDEGIAFAINATGFTILSLSKEGAISPVTFGDDTNSVLMQGAGRRDDKGNEVYEGDILFFRRPTPKGLLPVIGVVNANDFTYSVNDSMVRYNFAYADKDIEVLGNIFQNTDEQLAKLVEEKLAKYLPK